MPTDEDPQADLLRELEAVIDRAGLDGLRTLTDGLVDLGGQPARQNEQRARPDARRAPLPELQLFRIRVDLNRSTPPIWRRLELRSDLTLDVVHKVMQAVFDWWDYHLWRFTLGGGAFDRDAQAFLCPWDEAEDEPDDDRDILAAFVRLDEVMQQPGDVLSYLYDYGDNWELTLCLEAASPAAPEAPSAVALDGRRAAPPEDCGGRRTTEELAEVLEDPARFDRDAINHALRSHYMLLAENGFDRRVVDLLDRLAHSPVGEDVTARAARLLTDPGSRDDVELQSCFIAFRWFLDRAADGPIPLTAAGYLKPVDVAAVVPLLPTMAGWIGKANREIETTPVLMFRESLQTLGLLRKYKGTLRLTKAGAQAQSHSDELWNTLADRLPRVTDGFDIQATLLLLAYAATSADAELPLDTVAAALNHMGWRVNGHDPIKTRHLYRLPVLDLLRNIDDKPSDGMGRWRISPAAARLSRAALRPR